VIAPGRDWSDPGVPNDEWTAEAAARELPDKPPHASEATQAERDRAAAEGRAGRDHRSTRPSLSDWITWQIALRRGRRTLFGWSNARISHLIHAAASDGRIGLRLPDGQEPPPSYWLRRRLDTVTWTLVGPGDVKHYTGDVHVSGLCWAAVLAALPGTKAPEALLAAKQEQPPPKAVAPAATLTTSQPACRKRAPQPNAWYKYVASFSPGRPTIRAANKWAKDNGYSTGAVRTLHKDLRNPLGRPQNAQE
jgi:hypothetical protein